jgi:hypothetical protein
MSFAASVGMVPRAAPGERTLRLALTNGKLAELSQRAIYLAPAWYNAGMAFPSRSDIKPRRILWLTLCFAVAGMWVRSFFVEDRIERTTHEPQASGGLHILRPTLYSGSGRIELNRWRIELRPNHPAWRTSPMTKQPTPWLYSSGAPPRVRWYGGSIWELMGFRNDTLIGCGEATIVSHRLAVPYWMVMALVAVGPSARAGWAWVLAVGRRREARLAGLCPTCAYDLRATPERCPECGVVPAR